VSASKKIPKNGQGERSIDKAKRLYQRLEMLRAIRSSHEALPLAQRDTEYLKGLHKRINITVKGLKSAGMLGV
jgi:hypothetical protein